MILHHHEHWDGDGYPHHLAGEDIPLAARILCVADVFDALTTSRSYRDAFTPDVALEIMAGDAERVFDPELYERFREIAIPTSPPPHVPLFCGYPLARAGMMFERRPPVYAVA